MKKSKKIGKISRQSRQVQKKKWNHVNDIVSVANAPLNQTLMKLKIPGIGLTEEWIQNRQGLAFQKIQAKNRFHFFSTVLSNFKDPFTLILIAISIYSFIMFGLRKDITYIVGGVVVVFLVAFSVILDLIAKYAMYKDNKKIKNTSKETVKVLRNIKIPNNLQAFDHDEKNLIDHLTEIDSHELLVGDLIYLKAGDIVPADAKIIYDQDSLTLDQEILTGTKNAVAKKSFNSLLGNNIFQLSNIIYRGTKVVHGSLWALVVYKGNSTYYEYLKRTSVDKKEKTVFSIQTKNVTRFLITSIALFAPSIFILALVLAGVRNGFDDPDVWVDSIIFGMTVVICLAPDSLPLSLTSAFSHTRKVLANKKIISQDITAVQNIGAMDVLAIDMRKTFVNKEYILDGFVNLNNQSSQKVGQWALLSYLSSPSQNFAIANAIQKDANLMKWEKSLREEFSFIRKVNFYGVPRTYVSVVEDKNHQRWAIMRGPKSVVLSNSSAYYNQNGQIKKINKEHLNPLIKKTFGQVNQQGFWSIGIAIKKIQDFTTSDESEVLKSNYTYFGLANFVQSTISGSKETIHEFQKKALAIKYMSHEPLDQTLILARNLGFKVMGYLSKREINLMNDHQLCNKIRTTNVFYDLDYLTEIRVIKNYKKLGLTIGYLGQGLDNSLQLLNANIGITTHNTDVFAKQNANLIIQDGNFSDLNEAIVKGREASINIVKFIKIRTSWAIAITLKLAIGLIWFNAQPMNSMELLTLNLIYDIVEFLIIFDKVDPHYIQKPVRWDTKSILPFALWNGALFQLLALINVTIFVYVIEPGILPQVRQGLDGWEYSLGLIQTVCWLEDTISHFIFILVIRTHYKKWFKYKPTISSLTSMLVLGLFIILVPIVPLLNDAFAVENPSWPWWLFFLLLMVGYCFASELWKDNYVRLFNKWL